MDLKKRAEDIFDIGAEPAADLIASIMLEGVVGAVVPGAVSAMMAYRQKRSERMYEKFMIEVRDKHDEFDTRLKQLKDSQLEWFKTSAFPIVSDYVLQNKQYDKIEYLVNGFMNCASGKIDSDDILQHYYEMLDQLTILDLIVLKNISIWKDVNSKYDREIDLQGEDLMITAKLASLGLIETESIQYLFQLIKIIALSDESPDNSENEFRAELTTFGEHFLKFFCDSSEENK